MCQSRAWSPHKCMAWYIERILQKHPAFLRSYTLWKLCSISSTALDIIMTVLLHIHLSPKIPLWRSMTSLEYWTRCKETSGRGWWVEVDLTFLSYCWRRSRGDTPLTQRRTVRVQTTMWTAILRQSGKILPIHCTGRWNLLQQRNQNRICQLVNIVTTLRSYCYALVCHAPYMLAWACVI